MRYLDTDRKTRAEDEPQDTGRSRARTLLGRWGAAPLLYFALLPDKRYLFGGLDEGEWSIAYRVMGRHALALGDPLGDPAAVPQAVTAFLDLCRRHGWTPAFYQVTPAHLDTYRAAGLRTVKVGEDAQIYLAEFSLAGKHFKNLRNDLRRIEKAGVVRQEFGPDNPPDADTVTEMAAISDGWRRAHRAKEGHFAMGGFDPNSELFRESRLFVAREGETGRMLAFATFVPIFGAEQMDGWALDLMRRRADALHGVMDFLLVSAAQTFAAEDRALMSLGLSPLAGAEDPAEQAQMAFVRRFLFLRMNRIYNFQGLHTFKDKFATHWEPRFLIHRRGTALTATAGAVLKAHLGADESLHMPLAKRLRLGRAGQTRAMAGAALLLLLFTPFEKTLAKRAEHAVTHRHHWGRTWGRRSASAVSMTGRPAAGRGRAAATR